MTYRISFREQIEHFGLFTVILGHSLSQICGCHHLNVSFYLFILFFILSNSYHFDFNVNLDNWQLSLCYTITCKFNASFEAIGISISSISVTVIFFICHWSFNAVTLSVWHLSLSLRVILRLLSIIGFRFDFCHSSCLW